MAATKRGGAERLCPLLQSKGALVSAEEPAATGYGRCFASAATRCISSSPSFCFFFNLVCLAGDKLPFSASPLSGHGRGCRPRAPGLIPRLLTREVTLAGPFHFPVPLLVLLQTGTGLAELIGSVTKPSGRRWEGTRWGLREGVTASSGSRCVGTGRRKLQKEDY